MSSTVISIRVGFLRSMVANLIDNPEPHANDRPLRLKQRGFFSDKVAYADIVVCESASPVAYA